MKGSLIVKDKEKAELYKKIQVVLNLLTQDEELYLEQVELDKRRWEGKEQVRFILESIITEKN